MGKKVNKLWYIKAMDLLLSNSKDRTDRCNNQNEPQGLYAQQKKKKKKSVSKGYMYTQVYLKWITNKDLWYSTGNSDQC